MTQTVLLNKHTHCHVKLAEGKGHFTIKNKTKKPSAVFHLQGLVQLECR